ncbi:MAG: ABC transporter substrate-binding protein, partial [Anaerolineales bacterium]
MRLGAAAAGAMATGLSFSPNLSLAGVAAQGELASHVTLGNTSIQPNLNPFYFTYFQSRQIYDTLIEVSADGELLPGLALEWQRIDPMSIEVRLRDGVFFSNGDRFTSRSVQYTMEHLMTEGVNNLALYGIPISDFQLFPPQFALFNQDSIEIIDDLNLVIRATRPDAILEKRFSRLFVISEQFMNETDGDLTTQAAGTGYFRAAEFVPGELLELEYVEGNWRGEYPIRSATYVRVGDSRTALESGDIDMAQSLPPDIARTLVDNGDFNVSTKSSLATEIISMIPDTNPAFQDPRVRRALNLAIDKDLYNEVVRAGFGRPPQGQLLQPGMDGYVEGLDPFEYNPQEAMRLLNEAGARNLELTFAAPNTLRADAEVLAGFFEAVGVRVQLETPDSGTLISEIRAGTDRNMILWNAFYTTLSDWSQAMVGLVNPAPGAQRHFDNDEFYALNMQIQTAGDAETRTQLIEQTATLMNEEAAVIFLSWSDFYHVHTTAIESVPYNLDNSPQVYAIEKRA